MEVLVWRYRISLHPLVESKDPRKKDLPPRPSGQRPEPDRRGTGAFGNPFGNGNFQFSFGIGGFPFGLIGTFGNQGPNPFGFGQPQTPVRLQGLKTIKVCWNHSHDYLECGSITRRANAFQNIPLHWTCIHCLDLHSIIPQFKKTAEKMFTMWPNLGQDRPKVC